MRRKTREMTTKVPKILRERELCFVEGKVINY